MKETSMPATDPRNPPRRRLSRREFLERTGMAGAGAAALTAGIPRAWAQAGPSCPDWIPASTKPPKRGGVLTRASAWDPPVIDPRLTQSVGLYQFVGLTSNRLLRYPLSDEATGPSDMTLKGDLAESWQSDAAYRVWAVKLLQGVKRENGGRVNRRQLTEEEVKADMEAYEKE